MLDHIIAVIMRGLYFHGAASSKQPEDCICWGVKVSVKLRHVTMSRPEHSPIVLIYTSMVLLMIVMANMASVCGPFPQPGHICHRVFTKINIVRAAASWAKVLVYYSNVPAQSRHQMVITRSFLIPAN